MRTFVILMILTLASCASVETRTDRNSGVGFGTYDPGS